MAETDYLSVKKGNERKLPIADTENCLYICDNGNLYYGMDKYTPVSNPTGNPKTKGYYEFTNNSFILTQDTTVQSLKTYYTRGVNKMRINKLNKENTIGGGLVSGYGYADKYSLVINNAKQRCYTEQSYDRSYDFIESYEVALFDSTRSSSNRNKTTLRLTYNSTSDTHKIFFGEFENIGKPNPEPMLDADGDIINTLYSAEPSYELQSPYIIKIYANGKPLNHIPLFYYEGIRNNVYTSGGKTYLLSEPLLDISVLTENGDLDHAYYDYILLDLYKKNKEFFDKPAAYDQYKQYEEYTPGGSHTGTYYAGENMTSLTVKDNVKLTLKFFKTGSNSPNSIVLGEYNTLNSKDSQAILCGTHLTDAIGPTYTLAVNGVILGQWNNAGSDRGYVLTVGDGTGKNDRKNSVGITPSGSIYYTGTISGYGADYAEYFEWDKIPNIKDTRGLFVTLNKGKVRLANKEDKYIVGIISSNPGIIGNTQSEEWQGKYKTDIFGTPLKDENNQNILNPEYNENNKYIPREDRPEWIPIGLMGQIIAVDDGTCEEGGFCYPGVNGIATAAKDGYYVMERLDDNHIKVLFK